MMCTLGTICSVAVDNQNVVWSIVLKVFLCSGTLYYIIHTIDILRWWNGSDEDGNPK